MQGARDMNKHLPMLVGICLGLALTSPIVLAADQDRDQLQTQDQSRDQDRIYGSQLMTAQERAAFRNKMRAAKTVEERARIREQHHKEMQERARKRGIQLPDMPPARGMGNGMGPGGGMGSGGGPNR